jgi:hypothetical protein
MSHGTGKTKRQKGATTLITAWCIRVFLGRFHGGAFLGWFGAATAGFMEYRLVQEDGVEMPAVGDIEGCCAPLEILKLAGGGWPFSRPMPLNSPRRGGVQALIGLRGAQQGGRRQEQGWESLGPSKDSIDNSTSPG